MKNRTFSEAIKLKDGIFYNLTFHADRMNRTMNFFYGKHFSMDYFSEIIIPEEKRKGLYKCRIVYADSILSVEFIPYFFRTIHRVSLVENNLIDYSYKFTNREVLNNLLEGSESDEVIIVKNGFVTDASSSNFVFENKTGLYTPNTYLLRGTKREYLLKKGIIQERIIGVDDLKKYHTVHFINAMIDLEDNIKIAIDNVEVNNIK